MLSLALEPEAAAVFCKEQIKKTDPTILLDGLRCVILDLGGLFILIYSTLLVYFYTFERFN